MAGKGGATATTWTSGSTWLHGETKTVRIPIALADEIMAYARARDRGGISPNAVSHGNTADDILNAIAQYIEIRKRDRHNNQYNKDKELNLEARTWDELPSWRKNSPKNWDYISKTYLFSLIRNYPEASDGS